MSTADVMVDSRLVVMLVGAAPHDAAAGRFTSTTTTAAATDRRHSDRVDVPSGSGCGAVGYVSRIEGSSLERIDEHYRAWVRQRPRPALERRSLATHGAFVVEHLARGVRVLDVGCGPGSITREIARRVAPGTVVGLDIDEHLPAQARRGAQQAGATGLAFLRSDATAMPLADEAFDVVFVHALLQHVPDPSAVLRDCRRVLRPDGVICVGDTDLAAIVVHPSNPVLDSFFDFYVRLRVLDQGTPTVGRQLRTLLHEAGFTASVVSVDSSVSGDPMTMRESAAAFAAPLEARPLIAYAEAHHLATPADLGAMAIALREWGEHPGAMWMRTWFHAVGRPAEPRH